MSDTASETELSRYEYELPPDLIAQVPISDRTAARLMVVCRADGSIRETIVNELPTLLGRGDCLVLNDTRVSSCRFRARIGMRDAEVLMVRRLPLSRTVWEVDALVFPGRAFKTGESVDILDAADQVRMTGVVLGETEAGRRIRVTSAAGCAMEESIAAAGIVPLPPYITNTDILPERYQTCFADEEGSTAAPTAGLHFTPDLFSRIESSGVTRATLTLHIGPGTFRPVTSREIAAGSLHAEPYRLEERAASAIRAARAAGGRCVAVGTTVCRTLEWIASRHGDIVADEGETDLFIREGFPFRAVDALLTNFHLPRTSLLMLVCALAGRDLALRAYREAVARRFRFYSFGDAMLIL